MITALLVTPVAGAALMVLFRRARFSRVLLGLAAAVELVLVCLCWLYPELPNRTGWLGLDSLGLLVLTAITVLFSATCAYSIGYLKRRRSPTDGMSHTAFTVFLLLFYATMVFVTVCQQFELLWIAVEATTLASAPLIYFHKSRFALEATWKYLILCSVGIALALLGTVFLSVSAASTQGDNLIFSDLRASSLHLDRQWLRLAVVFLLVGYGTKAGLAPLHSWLPDAHSEAPSPVSALLSGASVTCAMLALLRVVQITAPSLETHFVRTVLLGLGLFSLAVGSFFLVNQKDYKRLLAYSTVEHMGVVAIGVGVGGLAVLAALIHLLGHALVKGMAFLTSGNLLSAYRSKRVDEVSGALKVLPGTGALWLAAMVLLTAGPPSVLFLSEMTLAKATVQLGRPGLLVVFLVLLTVAFVGLVKNMIPMALGKVPETSKAGMANDDGRSRGENALLLLPPAILAVLAVVMGIAQPEELLRLLKEALSDLGGRP